MLSYLRETCRRLLPAFIFLSNVPTILAQTPATFVDLFSQSRLDQTRWDVFIRNGSTIATGGGLRMSLNGQAAFSEAKVFTLYHFPSDFDVQVDFEVGDAWNDPFASTDSNPQLNGAALGVYMDDPNSMVIFRSRFRGAEGFNFYSSVDGGRSGKFAPGNAKAGSLRIVAIGGTYHFLFNVGSEWTELASAPALGRPVRVFLSAGNVNAHLTFSTTFKNFRINSGATDYEPFTMPASFQQRADFAIGGQFINSAIDRWNGGMSDYKPMDQLASQGMNLARSCMTTVSDPDLASTPPEQWKNLGWKSSYWSSREMIAQLFKDAAAAGMKINACYYLSDGPAYASLQNAPAAWKNLSVEQTAALVEQYTFETTTYLLNQGIQIDLYDVGNEILYGILNFQAGDRIPIPPGLDFTQAWTYLETSVWPTEATLLQAGIRGIRRADPAARIALHVQTPLDAGFESAYQFFRTMRSLGVSYDIAALSQYGDTSAYGRSSREYFQLWNDLVNRIASLGKMVLIAEGSYPAATAQGLAAPMSDFPYSDSGQSSFLRNQLLWASNNPSLVGWIWFYPEWFPGIGPTAPPELEVAGLFSSRQILRPAASELNRNLVQKPCEYAVGSSSVLASSAAGNSTSAVFAPFWCRWTVTTNAPWITITTRPQGAGDATIAYSIAANGSGSMRSGKITIAGRDVVVTQPGAPDFVTNSTATFTIPGGGAAVSGTTGASAASALVGYAALQTDTPAGPLFGTAIFTTTQNGVTVSEAGVPATAPTTAGVIFVDYRTGQATTGGRAIDINTGIALVNTGPTEAKVTYILRNTSGVVIATGHGVVPRGAHFAKFVDQLKDIAPDFAMPADFQTALQFASLEVSSDQPLCLLALRLTVNQRGETLLTSTPVIDKTKLQTYGPLYFPQYVEGGGYATNVVLLNTSSRMETGTVTILLDNGTVSSSSYSIEPAGVFVFQERRMPGPLMVGTLRIDPDRNTNTPAGAGIFSLSSAGFLVTESGIPSADPTNHARLYIDTSSGHDTGIALATTGDSAVNVRMSAYELNGITPVGTSAVVNVSTHRAQFVSQLIPGLPSGFVGVLDIAADGPFAALALRSLINGRGDFLLTTLPVADANATAVSPLVFPQIADGAGYTTEFILISPGAASKTTLYFYGEDGQPLALNINRRQ